MGSESAFGQAWYVVSAGFPLARSSRSRPPWPCCCMQFPGLILVQSELPPQINPTDVIISRQALWCSALEDHAVVHDVGAVRDPQRLADVVVGNQHPDAAVAQVKNDLLNIGNRDRVDPGEWFVEQYEFGRSHERSRDLRPPPLSARERVCGRLCERRKVELGQQFAQPGSPRRAVEAQRFENGDDVLFDGEAAED